MKKRIFVILMCMLLVAASINFSLAMRSDRPGNPPIVTGSPLTELYPEDYTFRSGLTYNVKYYEKSDDINPIKEERSIWNTRYPFADPSTVKALSSAIPINDNVGFKAKVIRFAPGLDDDIATGRVSYTLAVFPYLEAKETIFYNKAEIGGGDLSNYKVVAEQTKFDKFGNPKTSYSLGYTGNQPRRTFKWSDTSSDIAFTPDYKYYRIRNPVDPLMQTLLISSEYTTLQVKNPLRYEESEKKDTIIAETTYLYEINPNSPDGFSKLGWTSLPKSITVKDAYSRLLSKTQTDYETTKGDFSSCSLGEHVEYNNCYNPECINSASLNPFERQAYSCLNDGGDYCLRQAPNKMVSYTTNSEGMTFSSSGKETSASNLVYTKYDDCGNLLETNVQANYKHPFNGEELSAYTKTIQNNYDSNRMKPREVKILGQGGLDPITKKASYYSNNLIESTTDERGVTTYYDYDEFGRISRYWIEPDTENSPTGEYYYDPIKGANPNGIEQFEIRERKKISGDNDPSTPDYYTETYHFYDGMGRLIQSKTYDNSGTLETEDDIIIVSGKIIDINGRVEREYRPIKIRIKDIYRNDEENPYCTDIWDCSKTPWYTFDYNFNLGDFYYHDENQWQIDKVSWVEYAYDIFGRPTFITDKGSFFDSTDDSVVKNDYSMPFSGYKYDIVQTIDPLDNQRISYSDARGNLVKVELTGTIPNPFN